MTARGLIDGWCQDMQQQIRNTLLMGTRKRLRFGDTDECRMHTKFYRSASLSLGGIEDLVSIN